MTSVDPESAAESVVSQWERLPADAVQTSLGALHDARVVSFDLSGYELKVVAKLPAINVTVDLVVEGVVSARADDLWRGSDENVPIVQRRSRSFEQVMERLRSATAHFLGGTLVRSIAANQCLLQLSCFVHGREAAAMGPTFTIVGREATVSGRDVHGVEMGLADIESRLATYREQRRRTRLPR